MSDLTPMIICVGTPARAVVFGWTASEPVVNEPITLHHARMVLRWPAGCGGLFGLAANGPVDGLQITRPVDRTGAVVGQWLAVAPEAAAALREWPSV